MEPTDALQRFQTLVVQADGPVRVVTMNRPGSMNAADAVMHRELAEVWERLAADPACRAVVLTGAGRAFSAGGDLPRMIEAQQDRAVQDEIFDEARRIVLGMLAVPQPVVAAVNGPAVGLGASLVALCDLAVASQNAYLADPHLAVGLVPADGAAMLWPLTMGLMRAKEYVFSGARIPAATALEWGLLTRVVPPGEALVTALALAHDLAQYPARALQDTKRLMNLHYRRALTGLLDDALACEQASVNSPEHVERVRRLVEATRARAEAVSQ